MAGRHAAHHDEDDLMEVVRLLPDVLFRCYKADDGKIYWSLNEGGLAEEFHLTTKEIEGKSLEELFEGGASDELIEHFEAAFRGEPTVFTNQIGDQHFRHFPQPVYDDEGNVKEVVGFIADVTELVEAERRLEKANAELEAFSYSVSHDLRGPLSTMRVDATNLARMLPEGMREQRVADRLRRSTERLITIVDGLLALSRANRGPLQVTEVDMTATAKQVADDLERRESGRKVDWRIEKGLTMHADPALAQVLIQNLLENAWKFTRDQEEAVIEVGVEGGCICIRDNGTGFEDEDKERIFQAFTRLSGGHEGSGIGLATVSRIVERHGGSIEAEGKPGEGAVFRFTLGSEEQGGG